MRNTIIPLLLLSTSFLSGCQTTRQNYELVNVNDILLTADPRLHPVLKSYDKLRKMSLANWECYVPDTKPEETFFCTQNGEILVFVSEKPNPSSPQENSDATGLNEMHTHSPGTKEHTHND